MTTHLIGQASASLGPPIVGLGVVAASWSASEITAMAIATTALVAAIFTGTVNIIIALRSERKADATLAEAKVITGHVNSAASASKAEIDAMRKELLGLKDLIAERKQDAALLAQSVAIAAQVPAAAAIPQAPPLLEKIETNTAETAANTKRTDDAVADLKSEKQS